MSARTNDRARPAHAPIVGFPVIDHCLTIGGISIVRLAERIGKTPFYAYDRGLIASRVGELRRCLPPSVRLSYAVKANPMPAVVQHLAGLVDGFDVASAGELMTVLDTPMAADRISFAGPGKTASELERAVAANILIHMESEREMAFLAAAGERQGLRPRVAIRVNPDFQLKGSGMKMGGGAQQFGVDAARVPQMLSRLALLDLDFAGFHIFAGSQNLREDMLREAQEKTVDLAMSLAKHAPAPVRHLNIGGGFGIPYAPGDRRLDLERVCDALVLRF